MKVLITVGTTAFDRLFEVLDQPFLAEKFEFLAQTGPGQYQPKHLPFFTYSDAIQEHMDWADCVICHAGAGTVYDLLEKGKKCLVVANLDRVDKHQAELANWVSANAFALATCDLQQVVELLLQLPEFSPAPYQPDRFFLGNELSKLILSQY